MLASGPFDETWIAHLSLTYSLDEALVRRLAEEFLAASELTLEEFIVRRHLSYQEKGFKNEETYRKIAEELAHRRFRAPQLSLRQIRRIIYG